VFFNDPNHTFKYAKIEQERRFLLRSMPEDMPGDEDFIRIIDRYIPGTRLRLRRMESPLGDALIFKLGQKYRLSDFEDHQSTKYWKLWEDCSSPSGAIHIYLANTNMRSMYLRVP